MNDISVRFLYISFGIFVLISPGKSYVCPSCEHCEDPPTDCRGGVVYDECECCLECARILNETCGGQYGLKRKCDNNLYCALFPEQGTPVSNEEVGICKECPQIYEGCTIVGSSCVCDKSCHDDFEFIDEASCLHVLSSVANFTGEDNCTLAECGVMFMPLCTHDSIPVPGIIPEGQCCPEPPTCECLMDLCKLPVCEPDSELSLVAGGLGTPGICCDEFKCIPLESDICSEVTCPLDPLADIECPSDSYRLPSLISGDGCCEFHQGCQCLTEDLCEPPNCDAGMHVRVVSPGLGQPGFCCPRYECVNGPVTGPASEVRSCIHEGMEFKHEETWKLDHCTTCTCRNGLMFCKVALCDEQPRCGWMGVPDGECCPVCQGCISDNGQHANNETWYEDNWCTKCRCEQGQVYCVSSSCMVNCRHPRQVPGQCCPVCDEPDYVTLPPMCPLLMNCSLLCINGLMQDANDCYQCQCKPDECDLHCVHGFLLDIDGQELCECAPEPDVSECSSMDTCYKQCPYGYKRSRNGCLRCKCNKCPPFTCKKHCPGEYERNDEGCKLCRCEGNKSSTAVIPTGTIGGACMSSDGHLFDDGESWNDGCRTCFCHSGREMCALISCPVPKCDMPIMRSGDCCPSCPELQDGDSALIPPSCQSLDGVYRFEGEVWQLDRCTQCLCHSGRVMCDSERCAPLLCSNPVRVPNKCCPVCLEDATEVLDPSVSVQGCMSHNHTRFSHGDIWKVNSCQSCMCHYGQIMCYSQTCPVLDCQNTLLRKGQCCPVCPETKPAETCLVGDIVYSIRETWQTDDCTQCTCNYNRHSTCTKLTCEMLNCVNQITPLGECCPVCADASESQNQQDNEVVNATANIILVAVLAGLATFFAVIIILLLIILFHRRYRRRHQQANSQNIATLVTETKRPKSTNLDLQGIMPLLSTDSNTNTNNMMSKNCYDGTSIKAWSSDVDKNNTEKLEKTEELLKADKEFFSDKIDVYKELQV